MRNDRISRGSKAIATLSSLLLVLALVIGVGLYTGGPAPHTSLAMAAEPAGGSPPECPTSQVGKILGAQIFAGHGQTKSGQQGVKLDSVTPKGPAAKAGLKAGDIVTLANGKAVTCPMSLLTELSKANPAKKIVLKADRAGKPVTATFAPKSLNLKGISLPPAA